MKNIPLNNDNQKNYRPEIEGKRLIDIISYALSIAGGIPGALVYAGVSCYEKWNCEKLLSTIVEEIKLLKDTDREFFYKNANSDDGDSLLKYAFIKSAQCHRKEQIIKMVDIIIVSLVKKYITERDAEMLIDIVSSLNVEEATFLGELKKNHIEKCGGKNVLPVRIDFREIKHGRNKALTLRLIAKGLLAESYITSVPPIHGEPPVLYPESASPEGIYDMSYYGRMLWLYIY